MRTKKVEQMWQEDLSYLIRQKEKKKKESGGAKCMMRHISHRCISGKWLTTSGSGSARAAHKTIQPVSSALPFKNLQAVWG